MSFDLVVLAAGTEASLDDVRAMADQRAGRSSPGVAPTPPIAAFYGDLLATFPDLPGDDESPWISRPLAVGVDHVSMSIAHTPLGDDAVDLVLRLAEKHGLVVFDPQGDEATGLHGSYADPVD
ncbi:hypothetical protein [Asanoa siamensis]|uniref:hypothetical protein n=1 Tax=Asanoa siamensis TaxID=926357 RepID=UPI001EF34DB2|nr:hypothetical protein [Asanoa siamensis]